MNAAQLLAVSSPNASSNRSQITQKSMGQPNAFMNLLKGELDQSKNSTMVATNLPVGSESMESEMGLMTIEEILAAFEELFDLLSMNDGFFDPKLIEDPAVLALLNQLPQQLQQLVSDLLKSGLSFEQALAQTETGSKEQLTLLLLSALQLEKNGQLTDQMKQIDFMKQLQHRLNEVFNVKIQDQPQSHSAMLAKLAQLLEKNGNSSDNGQPLAQIKTDLREAIQRVLYNDSSNQGNSSDQQGTSSENGANRGQLSQLAGGQVTIDVAEFDQVVNGSIRETGSVNRIQQYVLNVQQSNGSTMPEDEILNQLKSIMKQSKFSTLPNGTNQLMLRLNPAHLGTLTIKLSETNGEMIARIIASTATAKEMIESNLQSLRHVFIAQNINVEKFNIEHQGEEQYQDANKEQHEGQKDGSKSKEQASTQDNSSETESKPESFKEELLNLIV